MLSAVIGPQNIRRQHSLMLWWVLLCDYCSSFCYLPKTSELGRAINAHIIVAAYYSDHCLVFRVCSVAELAFAFIILPPLRALQLSTPTIPSSFFRVTSHEHGACPPHLYTVVYFFHARLSEGRDTGSFFLQRIVPKGPTIAFPYNHSLSRRKFDGFRLYVCS